MPKTDDLFGDSIPQQPESNDPRARLFNMTPEIARRSGRDEESVRKQVGALCRQHKPARVLACMQQSQDAEDPLTYCRALLRGKRNEGIQDGKEAFLKG